MTTVIPGYIGPLKSEIISLAYEECGVSAADFDLTGEEYATGLRRLNALLSDWAAQGIDLAYNQPAYGLGDVGDASNIPPEAINTVASGLAIRLMPTMGQTASGEVRANYARSFALLQARYTFTPSRQIPAGTPMGRGNRWPYAYDAYGTRYVTDSNAFVVDGG